VKIFKTKEQREADKKKAELEKLRATTRTAEEIGKEYNKLCLEAGDKQYRKEVLESELKQINENMLRLNREFHIAQQVHSKTDDEKKTLAEPVKKVLNEAPEASA
jgi:hypothetical protein